MDSAFELMPPRDFVLEHIIGLTCCIVAFYLILDSA